MASRSLGRCLAVRVAGAALLALVLAVAAWSDPAAKVTSVTLSVYHQTPDGKVQWSHAGSLLPPGSRVCTLKRSACEIKFPDGSVIRMGPRSDLLINDVTRKNVKVVTGEVFAYIVSGTGAQIQGATASATIKGTSVLFRSPGGGAGDSLAVWNGLAELGNAFGSTPVGDGQVSSAAAGGAPSGAGGGLPYAFGDGNLLPFFQQVTPGTDVQTTPGSLAGTVFKNDNTTVRDQTVVLAAPTVGQLIVTVQSQVTPTALGVPGLALASAAGGGGLGFPPLGLAALGQALDAGREREVLGKRFAAMSNQLDLTLASTTGQRLGGGRLRTSAIHSHYYAEGGVEAFNDLEGQWDTRLSDLFVVDRLGATDLTAGRQRYLEGPVNNSAVGTLFGATHFDGFAVKRKESRCTIVGAWLQSFDTPSSTTKQTHGWLGRLSTPVAGGQVALNALQQGQDGWGFSGDLSFSVIPRRLDLYAELGCDPQGRHLETFGAYLPQLYQRAGVDLFVETAKRAGMPRLTSATAYLEAGHGWTGLGGVRRQQGGDYEFTIGAIKSFGSLSF